MAVGSGDRNFGMTSRTSLDYPDRDSNHSRGVFRALEKTHREAVQGVSARTLKRRGWKQKKQHACICLWGGIMSRCPSSYFRNDCPQVLDRHLEEDDVGSQIEDAIARGLRSPRF